LKLVWPNLAVEEGNLARNVSTLRSALGESRQEQRYIETIPWLGYRFVASVKEVSDESPRPEIDSIAVLPFVNVANDADLDYLSDGITDHLINSLSRLTALKVMSRNSTFRYKVVKHRREQSVENSMLKSCCAVAWSNTRTCSQ
jgi:hypothetical protein